MGYLKVICSFVIMFVFVYINYGQSLVIRVVNEMNQALSGAVVQLQNMKDSTIYNAVSDLKGNATFTSVANDKYTITIRFISFETIIDEIEVLPQHRFFQYRMNENSVALETVTITARRPLIRQEEDKLIVDPEPIAGMSSNTLEVMESIPGLFVDQDGAMYLTSATPAVVYINGREQKMSSQDIGNLLRSLPPEHVLRIEILRTPSSKYDASSSGGIINIILKKGVRIGRFGSVNAGMNQGIFGNRYTGMSLNNSNANISSYINVNYSYNDRLEDLKTVRQITLDTVMIQDADNRQKHNQINIGYGLSYDMNTDWNISYDGRIHYNNRNSFSDNTNMMNAYEYEKIFRSINKTENISDFYSLQQDVGFTRKLDTTGGVWETKISYNFLRNSTIQDYQTNITVPSLMSIAGEGDNLQNRHFSQLQSDITFQLPLKIKMETGVKTSFQQFTSQSIFFLKDEGIHIQDNNRTHTFKYLENISAGYIQASRNITKKIVLKTGVRLEHTYMNGMQTVPAKADFIVDRIDWFPYAYLSRPLFTIGDVLLQSFMIYRRTISRPEYQNLNPYIRYIDQFMSETGNPQLKPQFTDNVEVNVSFNEFPVFAVGRNMTTNVFSNVLYSDEQNQEMLIRTYDNLGSNTETYFRMIAGIPPGKTYFFALGAQYNLNKYDGVYEHEPFQYERGSWRLFTFHSLNLTKNTRLTCNGFMLVNGNYHFFELANFGMLNLGLTQHLLNRKLLITINARDILRTMQTDFDMNQGSISSYGSRYADSRRFGISVRYQFGLKPKESQKELFPFNIDE